MYGVQTFSSHVCMALAYLACSRFFVTLKLIIAIDTADKRDRKKPIHILLRRLGVYFEQHGIIANWKSFKLTAATVSIMVDVK